MKDKTGILSSKTHGVVLARPRAMWDTSDTRTEISPTQLSKNLTQPHTSVQNLL